MQAEPKEVSADKATTADAERAAFEAFVLSQWAGAIFHRRDALSRHDPRYGQYVDDVIQNAWVGWQGRAKLSAQYNLQAADAPIATCSRGLFETWVLETEHPVIGWVGADWLDQGDAPNTYANDYIQGAWVMWQYRQPLQSEIPRDLLGVIVDEVFDGAIEDASVIEDIYRVIARSAGGTPPAGEVFERNNERTLTSTLLISASHFAVEITPELIASWSDAECQAVEDYCIAIHYKASDNPGVVIPPRPAVLGGAA